jgi:hypothetical protein
MFLKMGRLEEPTEEQKKRRMKKVNNAYIDLCTNKTQQNTVKTIEQYRVGGKGEEK